MHAWNSVKDAVGNLGGVFGQHNGAGLLPPGAKHSDTEAAQPASVPPPQPNASDLTPEQLLKDLDPRFQAIYHKLFDTPEAHNRLFLDQVPTFETWRYYRQAFWRHRPEPVEL